MARQSVVKGIVSYAALNCWERNGGILGIPNVSGMQSHVISHSTNNLNGVTELKLQCFP